MRNYKKIRQQPYIYGFTAQAFILFTIISVLLLLTLIVKQSITSAILVLIGIGINYLVCRHFLSDATFISKVFDKKLPNIYTKYE